MLKIGKDDNFLVYFVIFKLVLEDLTNVCIDTVFESTSAAN